MNVRDESEKCIAVFGLTGDPFTIAHRQICKQAMDKLPIDKLYVIPTIVDYHRKGKETWLNDGERLECMKGMLWSLGHDYLGKWEIDRHEIDLRCMCEFTDEDVKLGLGDQIENSLCSEIVAKRRFIHTLLDLKTRIGMFTQIMLILGTDSLKNLTTWHRWRDVCYNISSLVVINGRDGEQIDVPPEVREVIGSRYCNLPMGKEELLKVSASKVRSECKEDYLTVSSYLKTVKDYDQGRISLKTLGWV